MGTEAFQQVAQVNAITRVAFPEATTAVLGLAMFAIYWSILMRRPLPPGGAWHEVSLWDVGLPAEQEQRPEPP